MLAFFYKAMFQSKVMETPQFTLDQRLWIALHKEKKLKTAFIKSEFVRLWPDTRPPSSKTTIWRIWKKLQDKHTVKNLNKGKSGRVRTGRFGENIGRVRELLEAQAEK